jgi:hypothetical protein
LFKVNNFSKTEFRFFYENGFFSFFDLLLYRNNLYFDLHSCFFLNDQTDYIHVDIIYKFMCWMLMSHWFLRFNRFRYLIKNRRLRKKYPVFYQKFRVGRYRSYFINSLRYRCKFFMRFKARRFFCRSFRRLWRRVGKRALWFPFLNIAAHIIKGLLFSLNIIRTIRTRQFRRIGGYRNSSNRSFLLSSL